VNIHVMSQRDGGRAIDRYLADFDVRSAHSIEVDAPADVTYRAVRTLDLDRSLPVAALLAVRGIPHFLSGKARPSRSLTLDSVLELGFTMLEEREPSELVIGTVGRFWRPDSGLIRVTSEEFLAFDEPGHAKAALTFVVDDDGDASVLSTETRVACTDSSARRKFSMYWRVVGPFSGYIRRVMLDQAKHAAEEA
jgi:hypothetical protein